MRGKGDFHAKIDILGVSLLVRFRATSGDVATVETVVLLRTASLIGTSGSIGVLRTDLVDEAALWAFLSLRMRAVVETLASAVLVDVAFIA